MSQLKAIYSSKLYKSSKRKDKIRAAIEDPINTELVEQLSSYLDEEYQVPVKEEKPEQQTSQPEQKDSGNSGGGSSSPSFSGGGGGGSFGGGGFVDEADPDDLDFDEGAEGGEGELPEGEEANDTVDLEDVEEATYIEGVEDIESLSEELDSLKGTLNSRDDVNGVSRIKCKDDDNEVWIYYNDDINLNNIMADVIEVVESLGYTYLEFNRLARSENAIVFEVVKSTDKVIDSE